MIKDPRSERDDSGIDQTPDSAAHHQPNTEYSSDVAGDQQEQLVAESEHSASMSRDRLPWQEAAGIVAQLADAADKLHVENRIHGRICHQAITIGPDGEATLTAADFMLPNSRTYDESDRLTLGIAAPECIKKSGERIDRRTDVYGLGVVLYHMLCGRDPFRAQDAGELRRQITRDAPQPPRQLVHGVPRAIESACLQALSKDPARRFQSAAHLAAALRTALEQADLASQSSINLSVPQSLETASRRNFVMIEFALVDEASDHESIVRGGLKSQLDDLAVACLQDITVDQVDWAADGLAIQIQAGSADEVAKAAIAAGLQLVHRIRDLFQDTDSLLSDDSGIAVRIQVAELSDHSASDSSSEVHGQIDNPQHRRTRLEATVQRDRIALPRDSLERIGRWYACTVDNSRDLWTVSGSDLPALDLHIQRSPELPFQGRNPQFSMLRDRWAQACDGMGQIVLLIGEEGIGKTRLVSELELSTRQSATDGVLAVQWNCLPRYGNQGLQPAVAWFRRQLGLDETDDVAEGRRRLDELCQQHDRESTEVTDGIADLIGVLGESDVTDELTQTQRRQRHLSALLQWLKAIPKHSPVLFIVEDLQWADPATLTLLNQLLERGLNDRLLSIFTLRPEFETPWGSRAHQTQITLNRFSRRHLASVLASAWGIPGVEDTVLESAMEKTHGVPSVVEEYVKHAERSTESTVHGDKGTSQA